MPLVIRIIKNRKASEIHLGYRIKESDWDVAAQRVRKSYPNATRLNNFLLKKISEANNGALELETNKMHVTASAVKNKIKPSAGSTFFDQSKVYLDNLKAGGKYNQYTADKPRIKHFKDFIGQDIAFQDITITMLERYKTYLKGLGTLGERSIANHIVAIRSVYSQAKKDNL